jgi:hypothetical protein
MTTSFAARMMMGDVARQRPPGNPWSGLERDKPGGSPARSGDQASGVRTLLQRFWMAT